MTDTITLTRPDDWHLHLRDGAMLDAVTPDTAADFGRALIMPNLVPPVVTGADAAAYRDRIMAAIPAGADFTPMMTLYLTEGTDPGDLLIVIQMRQMNGKNQIPSFQVLYYQLNLEQHLSLEEEG